MHETQNLKICGRFLLFHAFKKGPVLSASGAGGDRTDRDPLNKKETFEVSFLRSKNPVRAVTPPRCAK